MLIVLGTPSTVATVSGETFYYISQRAEQKLAFMKQNVTNQRVIAVYFDKNRRVQRLANYGLKDGKVFDFISRTTPTSGVELNYVNYMFAITKPLGNSRRRRRRAGQPRPRAASFAAKRIDRRPLMIENADHQPARDRQGARRFRRPRQRAVAAARTRWCSWRAAASTAANSTSTRATR